MQPKIAVMVNRSCAQKNPVIAAKTGSIAKIKATLVVVVNFWKFVCAKKANAVANTDVMKRAIYTLIENKTFEWNDALQFSNSKDEIIESKDTVVSWIIVSRSVGNLSVNFPVKIICRAKLIAQTNTSTSPILNPEISVAVRKKSPNVAITTPKIAFLLKVCFNKIIENNGTKTTLNPVINPALDDVVYSSPTVCVA